MARSIPIRARTGAQLCCYSDVGPARSGIQFQGVRSWVAIDLDKNLYIADTSIRRYSSWLGGTVSKVAGVGYFGSPNLYRGFSGDGGPATSALLDYPVSVAVDKSGNLYIADSLNQRVREVSNGVITTVVGNGRAGFTGDSGPSSGAEVAFPSGVAVDSSGNLYIADAGNKRIRVVTLAPTISTLSPSSAFVGSAAFTLTVNGTNFQSRFKCAVEWHRAYYDLCQRKSTHGCSDGEFDSECCNSKCHGRKCTECDFRRCELFPSLLPLLCLLLQPH